MYVFFLSLWCHKLESQVLFNCFQIALSFCESTLQHAKMQQNTNSKCCLLLFCSWCCSQESSTPSPALWPFSSCWCTPLSTWPASLWNGPLLLISGTAHIPPTPYGKNRFKLCTCSLSLTFAHICVFPSPAIVYLCIKPGLYLPAGCCYGDSVLIKRHKTGHCLLPRLERDPQ